MMKELEELARSLEFHANKAWYCLRVGEDPTAHFEALKQLVKKLP